jgi:hypothetical protein
VVGIQIAAEHDKHQFGKEKAMKTKQTIMLLLIFSCIFAICFSVYADDARIYGCYKKNGGQLRVVDNGSRCLPSEVPISWNQSGPAGPSGTGPSVPVRQIESGVCTGGYGWCPNGFNWTFQIPDPAVTEGSVIAINIVNPLLYDYGCEVVTKGAGEFRIMCIGDDYVKPGAILQYAVFNP